MKQVRMCSLVWLALIWVPTVLLAEQRNDDLDLLMRYLSPIETLTGDFRQQTLDARQQTLQVHNGQFALTRSGPLLLWETAAPDQQTLRVRDETLWLLDIALEQLVIQDLGDMWEQSPALLLTGERSEIAQRYDIEAVTETAVESHFILTPRDPSSPVERIEMRFIEGQPEHLRLLDSFQQTTLVVFQNLNINEVLTDSAFEFAVPSHFDVIDQRVQ